MQIHYISVSLCATLSNLCLIILVTLHVRQQRKHNSMRISANWLIMCVDTTDSISTIFLVIGICVYEQECVNDVAVYKWPRVIQPGITDLTP